VRRLLLAALLLAWPASAAAQSSIFGIRGPGFPGRPLSARAAGTAGAFALFDGESSLGPGSLGYVVTTTGTFTSLGSYRSVSSPAGDADVRSVRFPQMMVSTPFRRGTIVASLSTSLYTDRDFTIATRDTLTILGEQVGVIDTLSSRGGLSDLRLGVAYRGLTRTTVGVGFHFITGVSRLRLGRRFEDSAFVPVVQRSEFASSGVGLSLGATRQLGERLWVGGVLRKDFRASLDLDSLDVGSYALPWMVSAGVRWRVMPRLDVAAQGVYRAWSSADSLVRASGGSGSEDMYDLSAGVEYYQSVSRPGHLPIRVGVRYATIPTLTDPGVQPSEFGISVGTGARFARERGGLEVALERVWRSDGAGREETAWLLFGGVSIRP
jgi:hypothetical protein